MLKLSLGRDLGQALGPGGPLTLQHRAADHGDLPGRVDGEVTPAVFGTVDLDHDVAVDGEVLSSRQGQRQELPV